MESIEPDQYIRYESSDEEGYDSESSSDDELQKFIKQEYGIANEKKINEFEDEMEKELDEQMRIVEDKILNRSRDTKNQELPEDRSSENKQEQPSPSNDDLFYDPEMDKNDQEWIDEQRRAYIYPNSKIGEEIKPLPNSDAVLNCPACMSLLCLDCQRHEIYKSQYRAMFVTNCIIDRTQKLHYPVKGKKTKDKNTRNTDEYYPVNCSVCNTSIAVYDREEIYHFFNVISSYT